MLTCLHNRQDATTASTVNKNFNIYNSGQFDPYDVSLRQAKTQKSEKKEWK